MYRKKVSFCNKILAHTMRVFSRSIRQRVCAQDVKSYLGGIRILVEDWAFFDRFFGENVAFACIISGSCV